MRKKCVILALSFFLNAFCSFASDYKREVVVIVDGISTGKYLAPLFRESGYDVVHVSSNLGKQLSVPFKGQDYVEVFEESDVLLAELKGLDKVIKAVIPGCESGIDLAEKLQRDFDLPRNKFNPSQGIRNKFYMQENLRRAGLPAINQLLTHDYQELLRWVDTQQYPIVLKPMDSAGSDGVYICSNESELKKYFQKILGSKNIYHLKNQKVLCQEYIGGQEFMVHTVSKNGVVYNAEIIKKNKKVQNNLPLNDYSEFLDPGDEHFQLLSEFIKKVYLAFGIQEGAGRADIKVVNQQGKKVPYLIEVAPRLGGTGVPSAINEAQGVSQVSLLVDSIVRPNLLHSFSNKKIPENKKAVVVYLFSPISGVLNKAPTPRVFNHLKTFYHLHFYYKEGHSLSVTTDITNFPGYVYLVGSQKNIETDIKRIREIEKTLYDNLIN